jgi:hypothetical protein
MFSKLIGSLDQEIKNEFIDEPIKPCQIITYSEYYKNTSVLSKYKQPQLKQLAKYYKLPISGTKPILLERLTHFFLRGHKAEKIQKVFRGYIVRNYLKDKMNGLVHIKNCVNENDFFSLEPLTEIPIKYLFVFSCGNFNYGCSIISLIQLIKNSKNVVKNPYNRENIEFKTIKKIINVYEKIKLIFGLPNDAPVINNYSLLQIQGTIQENHRVRELIARDNNSQTGATPEMIEERRNKLAEIQSKDISTRIQEVFMEMDQLGNYTHPGWFSSLDRREYIRFFRILYDIWSFRGQLSTQMKSYICIIGDPFTEIRRQGLIIHDMPIEMIQDMCLKVIEYMVYCGIDDEYKKIGALHILTGLTGVSMGARTSLPWLYESLYG